MSIAAKELAKILQLSEVAVSMALNNRARISIATRQRVLKTARKQGYNFSRIQESKEPQIEKSTVSFIIFKRHGVVVTGTPFFNQLTGDIDLTYCQARYSLNINYLCAGDNLPRQLFSLSYCSGMILLTTKMTMENLRPFKKLDIPLVTLDTYFRNLEFDCVSINNFQDTYQATDFLVHKTKSQPGYLRSSYLIGNFQERTDGFYKAIREDGFSPSRPQVPPFSPPVEGICEDVPELLKFGEEFSRCCLVDSDLITAGAMKAIKEMGYVIPRNISIISFDNMPLYTYTEPVLSTVHTPKQYMGRMAVSRLIQIIGSLDHCPVKVEIRTKVINRKSVQGTVERCR